MGIKEITPFEIIRKKGDQYNIYTVNKLGLPDIKPKRIIKIKENPTIFGILLLPSIKRIMFEPGHTKIKTIQHIKNIPKEKLNEERWLMSEPKSK